MRLKKLAIIVAALTMVLVLAACGSSADQQGSTEPEKPETKKEEKTSQTTPDVQVAPDKGNEESEDQAEGPQNKTMKLTVPKMAELDNDTVPTGPGSLEGLFKNYAGVHLSGTGFPWEKEANVYIAGHRLGYQGTSSYLAFYDINNLQNGDEIFLEDSEGKKYTYVVFNTIVTTPTDLSVLEPIEGKNIVSLQTCTLPDYVDRVIVQGELKA
jgi:sortase A